MLLRRCSWGSRPSGEGKGLEKPFRVLVTDNAEALYFPPLRVKEDDSRRTEERKALEQGAVLLAVRSHVGLQEQHRVHLRPDLRVGESELLHLLARHAPVGVEI